MPCRILDRRWLALLMSSLLSMWIPSCYYVSTSSYQLERVYEGRQILSALRELSSVHQLNLIESDSTDGGAYYLRHILLSDSIDTETYRDKPFRTEGIGVFVDSTKSYRMLSYFSYVAEGVVREMLRTGKTYTIIHRRSSNSDDNNFLRTWLKGIDTLLRKYTKQ